MSASIRHSLKSPSEKTRSRRVKHNQPELSSHILTSTVDQPVVSIGLSSTSNVGGLHCLLSYIVISQYADSIFSLFCLSF